VPSAAPVRAVRRSRQARELLAGQVKTVLVLVDVAGEGGPELNESGAEPLHLGAFLLGEGVAAGEVAPGEPNRRASPRWDRSRPWRRTSSRVSAAERQVGLPFLQALLGLLGGVAHRLVRMDPGMNGPVP
jgi:hypothetical protein